MKSGHLPHEEYKKLWDTITSGGEWRGEFQNRRKDGREFWEFASISPVRNIEGTITHFVAVKEDISQSKQIRKKLEENEARYRYLFDNNLAGSFVSTPDGRLLACNPAFARTFGFKSVKEASQTNMNSLYQDEGERKTFITQLLIKKRLEHYELDLRRRDGRLVQVIENVIGEFDELGALVEIRGTLLEKRDMVVEQN